MPVSTFNPNTANGELWDEVLVEEFVTAINDRPKGQVGYAQVTATQGSITTLTDLTSLSVSVTTEAGRRYKITAEVYAFSTVGNDVIGLVLADGSNTQLQSGQVQPAGSSVTIKMTCTLVHTPGSGTRTYKLRMQRVSGTGTVTMGGYANAPAFILVEDLGLA